MRGDAAAHDFVAPGTLEAVLDLLASAPGKWTPIAGGTELMVAHAAGRLRAKALVNLWGIPELRFIRSTDEGISIGAATTFRDLRMHERISAELPLLAKSATWIGSIANQNRATIGGNLVNGSPAADSSPPLLVYDAEIELVSTHGSRLIPYAEFHTGYKKNVMQPLELMFAIHIPRRHNLHKQYLRKVGTRRAMAISKVALAGTALMNEGVIQEIRLAAASLAPFPARLPATERNVVGQRLTPALIQSARQSLLSEVSPIDDIRSTAEYRKVVGANLLQEFLEQIQNEAPA